MTKQQYSIGLTILFCGFLGGIMALNLITPDQIKSHNENRQLAQMPELTTETIMDGSFMTKFETYVNDQFVGRDMWVALKTNTEWLLGKKENNDVFFASEDTLINRVNTPDPTEIEEKANYVNTLTEKIDLPIYVGIIPTSAEIWQDRLPNQATTADEEEIINHFYANLNDDLTTLPLLETLTAQADQEIYYRTDHHWTSLGAYHGYTAIAQGMGLKAPPLDSYTPNVVSTNFNGTIFSTSGVRWATPDTITTYVPEDGIEVTTNFKGTPEEGTLYVEPYLSEKDQYSFFLGGNQPQCIIKTENVDAPSILVIRDSYADSLAPFLTENFSEIHLLDLRYFNAGVSTYLQMYPLDQVLVLYSITNLINDNNFFKMGM
ncbi:MAG: DHHW family protein [Eubacteriales bacterium]